MSTSGVAIVWSWSHLSLTDFGLQHQSNAYFLPASTDAGPSAGVVKADEPPAPISMIDTIARNLCSNSSSGCRCKCARSCFTLPHDESSLSRTFCGLLPTVPTAAAPSSTRASSRRRLIQRVQTRREVPVSPSPPSASPLRAAACSSEASLVDNCSICAISVSMELTPGHQWEQLIRVEECLEQRNQLAGLCVLDVQFELGKKRTKLILCILPITLRKRNQSGQHSTPDRPPCRMLGERFLNACQQQFTFSDGQQPQNALSINTRQYAFQQILHRILLYLGHGRCRNGGHLRTAAYIVLFVCAASQLFLCQKALLGALFLHLLLGLDRQLIGHVLQA
uniref:Uncharacterized protein n=1 Tax=Anopheles culicifacies TaxID=139723 RepID=A0A182MIZ9_9DIPT